MTARQALRMCSILIFLSSTLIASQPAFAQGHAAIENCRSASHEAENACLRNPILELLGPVEPQVPVSETVTGIGSEQVSAKAQKSAVKSGGKQKSAAQESSVIDFSRAADGRLVLILDNGQIWAQRAGDIQSVSLEKNTLTPITIRPGTLSGYRIHFTQKRRTIAAERLQ